VKKTTCVCLCSVALLLGALAAPGTRAQSANEQQAARRNFVSGQYKIVETNDLGKNEIRATLLIRLTNASETQLSVTRLEFPGSRPAPRSAGAAGSQTAPEQTTASTPVSLAAHSSATTRQQFTVSSGEYAAWLKGLRPRLRAIYQADGAPAGSQVVQLMRAEGIREE
jgi:hypothetical protein